MNYLRYIPYLIFFYLAWRLWDYPFFIYTEPPLWLALGALAALVYWGRRVPMIAWLWWGWGLLTLAWSLAPGNTLVASIWELPMLAALVVGRWRWGVLAFYIYLLLVGLFTAMALFHYGLVQYSSGSVHYLLGEQALWLVPLALYWMHTHSRFRWPAALLASVAIYSVLISGARAAYLPLALILVAVPIFISRQGVHTVRVLGSLILIFAVLFVVDAAIPGHPAQTALVYKSQVTQRDAQTVAKGIGNVGARLTMWKLAVHMAVKRPLGTGNGSYAQVFEGFMDVPKYDGAWSRSPHNYLLETLATGGWPRFFLLLVLLLPIMRGFFSDRWPWALSASAIWTTLLFDVTGSIPSFLILAFLSLGPLLTENKPMSMWVWGMGLGAAIALVSWWYFPCTGSECAIDRYRGLPAKVHMIIEKYPDRAGAILQRVEALYPRSPWPLLSEYRRAKTTSDQIAQLELLVKKFPYANVNFYIALIHAYREQGENYKAKKLYEQAKEIFPRSRRLSEMKQELK